MEKYPYRNNVTTDNFAKLYTIIKAVRTSSPEMLITSDKIILLSTNWRVYFDLLFPNLGSHCYYIRKHKVRPDSVGYLK